VNSSFSEYKSLRTTRLPTVYYPYVVRTVHTSLTLKHSPLGDHHLSYRMDRIDNIWGIFSQQYQVENILTTLQTSIGNFNPILKHKT
jgi:hypothetical protein